MKTNKSFNPQYFYREVPMDSGAREAAAAGNTVALSFSSEVAARRWYGLEILDHSAGAVDLARLQTMGAALVNHDPNQIVGPVTSAEVRDFKGVAEIAFDEDDESQKARAKVRSGSLRGVSVGYMIRNAIEVPENSEYEHPRLGRIAGPALIATKWEPIEISLTPIPLDSTVGVGRDATRSLDGIVLEPLHIPQSKGVEPMDKRLREYLLCRGMDAKADDAAAWEFLESLRVTDEALAKAAQSADDAPEAEDESDVAEVEIELVPDYAETIRAVLDRAEAAGQVALAVRLAFADKTEPEIVAALDDALRAARTPPVGPTPDASPAVPSDAEFVAALRGGI